MAPSLAHVAQSLFVKEGRAWASEQNNRHIWSSTPQTRGNGTSRNHRELWALPVGRVFN